MLRCLLQFEEIHIKKTCDHAEVGEQEQLKQNKTGWTLAMGMSGKLQGVRVLRAKNKTKKMTKINDNDNNNNSGKEIMINNNKYLNLLLFNLAII